MAARRRDTPEPKGPTMPLEKGLQALRLMLEDGLKILGEPYSEPRISAFFTDCTELLKQVFGEDSGHLSTWYGPMQMSVSGFGESAGAEQQRRARRHKTRLEALQAIIEAGEGQLRRNEQLALLTAPDKPPEPTHQLSNKVFIVHGRDELLKTVCARLLEKLGLEPVILHEQANQGLTLIEKFEKHSSVGYAIILLTADDVGGLASKPEELLPRARQNVIFEMGFFAGTLKRARVCVLYQDGVELPSDLSGIAHVGVDPGETWKLLLAKEMKAAGLEVDLNRIM